MHTPAGPDTAAGDQAGVVSSFMDWRHVHTDLAVIDVPAICRAVYVPRLFLWLLGLGLADQPVPALRQCLVFQGAMGLPLPLF